MHLLQAKTIDFGSRFASSEAAASEAVCRLLVTGGYELVAWIDGESPEDAWRLTQNGASSVSWSRLPPPGVHPYGDGIVRDSKGEAWGRRSSDVADLVINANGELWRVATVGFVRIVEPPAFEMRTPQPRYYGADGRRLHWSWAEQQQLLQQALESDAADADAMAKTARCLALEAGMPDDGASLIAHAARGEWQWRRKDGRGHSP